MDQASSLLMTAPLELRTIGFVRSSLRARAEAPSQADEGAPQAIVEFDAEFAAALEGLAVGDELDLLTWLHLADRDVLRCHPRDDLSRPMLGVFATRSSDRPNPIGLHPVRVVAI